MAPATVNLNVFTNVASNDPRDCLAPEAVTSFFRCFGERLGDTRVITRIFIDPKPHRDNYQRWLGAIRAGLPNRYFEIVETEGLIDGFWRSVEMSESPYAIQLEHDFVFLKNRIEHSIPELLEEMQRLDINFLRFNKRRNLRVGYDFFLERDSRARIPLSRISGRSNNPHIIHLPYYRMLKREIADVYESGLEGGLCRRAGGGYMYGAPGWPKTVQHLDGRHVRWKDGIARMFWLARRQPPPKSVPQI